MRGITLRWLAPVLLAGLGVAAPVQADPLQGPLHDPLQEMISLHRQFRQQFNTGHFAEALPVARRLVQLVERTGELRGNLATAYNNLGVVQFELHDLEGAEASFKRALDLLEQTVGIGSRRLISPLAGIGAVYAAQQQHAHAAEALRRAVGISRRADGLFNLNQMRLLDPLILAYENLGLADEAEEGRRYQLQIMQHRYGDDDPRTVPTLTRLALWYERHGRFPEARTVWMRQVEVGSQEGDERNETTINGLLGITRSYRLQRVLDPDSLREEPTYKDPYTRSPDLLMASPLHLTAPLKVAVDMEKSAKHALEILDGMPDPPKMLLARTLVELGDWQTTAHSPASAAAYYGRAWPLLQESLGPDDTNPLATPRQIDYRVPVGAVRFLNQPDVRTVKRELSFALTIAQTGEVVGVESLSGDAPEDEVSQVRRALERAWFSPRFEDGKPVATSGFRFTQDWFEIAPPSESPAQPPAEAPPAAKPPPSG